MSGQSSDSVQHLSVSREAPALAIALAKPEEHPLPPQGGLLVLTQPEPEKPKRTQKPKRQKTEPPPESPEFQEFYALYPRKVKRDKAWSAYREQISNGQHAQVMAGLKAQLTAINRELRSDGDFRPHPSTWLNEHRWRDADIAGGNGYYPDESKPNVIPLLTPPVRKNNP